MQKLTANEIGYLPALILSAAMGYAAAARVDGGLLMTTRFFGGYLIGYADEIVAASDFKWMRKAMIATVISPDRYFDAKRWLKAGDRQTVYGQFAGEMDARDLLTSLATNGGFTEATEALADAILSGSVEISDQLSDAGG